MIDVADIDEKGVGIFRAPAVDLRDAARHAAEVGAAVVVGGREDVTVEIGGVEDGDGNFIGGGCGLGAKGTREDAGRGGAAEETEKGPTIWGSNIHAAAILTDESRTTIFFLR